MARNLGVPERAALILIAANGGSLVATELRKAHGLDLKAEQRRRLIERSLIDAPKEGRSFRLTLTDAGWRFLDDGVVNEELPRGSNPGAGGRALFALVSAIAARGETLRNVLGGKRPPPAAPPPLEERIASAYHTLASGPREWVALRALRERLADVAREDLDAALHRMRRDKRLTMTLEEDRSRLTKADRDAALTVGPDPMHYLSMG